MGDAEFAQTAADATVFGRITPEQKEALVTTLRNQGEYVAMIGDGVNDVLSSKKPTWASPWKAAVPQHVLSRQ